MGKKSGKTPPKLREELEKVFNETASNVGETGYHIFVKVDLPRLADMVVVGAELALVTSPGNIEIVCRVRVVSFPTETDIGTVVTGVIDFRESELDVYNGTPMIISLGKIIKTSDGKFWIEERYGPYNSGGINGRLLLPPPNS